MDAATPHAMANGMVMATASAGPRHSAPMAAVIEHAPASRHRGDAPTDDGCPMHGRGDSPCTVPIASQTRHDGVHGLMDGRAAGGSPAPGSSSGTMPADCAVAAHCAALTVAAFAPVVSADTATIRVTRVSADGPLLGPSESAPEPTAPPPRG